MDAATTTEGLPRAPFLQRLSPHQWATIDVVIAALFFIGATGNVYHDLSAGLPASNHWLILLPLIAVATVPVAVRRRAPVFALVCATGASAVLTVLGHSVDPVPAIALPLYTVTVTYARRISIVALALVEATTLIGLLVSALLRPVVGDITFTILLAAVSWFAGDSVRTRRIYQAGLVGQAEERQRREIDRAQQAIAEERLGIARELHDVVAHSLSVIAIQSGVGRHVIDTQPEEARNALEAVERTSRSALGELRRVLGVLRSDAGPELAPAPTIADIGELIDRVREAGVPIEFAMLGTQPALPQGLELSVYRIVQEALTNVTKHARSASTRVCIQFCGDAVAVDVINQPADTGSGTGHAPGARAGAEPGAGGRHGIIGMHERASAFGGTLSATPLPDGGFRVQAELPLVGAG
jgi:signal transduction histidine kinase